MRTGAACSRVIRRLLVAGGIALVLGSCDKGPTRDDGATTVVVDNATSFFAVQVSDARTGRPLDGAQVKLRIAGADASRVIDVAGDPVTQLTTEHGFMALGLTGAVPTTAAPAELLVVATAPGYLETSQRLTLTAASSDPAIISMVSLAAPPPGVAVGTGGGARAGPGGVLVSTVTVQTAPDAVTGGRASVTLPAGVTVRDQAGTPLSGPLQTTVVYFNNQNFESLAAFPGGFRVRVENPPAGTPAEGVFTSAGYAAITVRDGAGREARNFSAPVQVSVDVPAGTLDPETGAPVKDGDVVPYWSYEPATGRWRYEGQVTLAGPNEAGNFTATVAMSHLTFLNLDWDFPGCQPNPLVHIVGNDVGRALWYEIRSPGWVSRVLTDSLVLEIRFAPQANEDVPVEIEARDPSTGMRVGLFQTRRICPGPHQMTVDLPTVSPSITVTLHLRCGDVKVLPWGWLVYRKVGDQPWLWGGDLRAGEGVIRGLEPNTRYEVTAAGIYAGVTFSGTTTVTTGADASDTLLTIEFGVDSRLCAKLRTHDQGGG